MTYAAPLDDMRFVLNHVAGLPEIAALPGCEDAEPELVEAILIEASRFCQRGPGPAERDRRPPGLSLVRRRGGQA
jgi:3-(methylsulfanyl)propanoyl-CoA dehydrogenase